ncbi:ABC transporter permease [Falsirhodobacter sp. alg1]|uniref:ABC transporter permease n=1 Tax=Falsirhodobacter sp. alg1 TaxID=1472418 RepID=UPI0005EDDF1F|nr:ABC transporter permease [Falsirhodobacter sp. alg1]
MFYTPTARRGILRSAFITGETIFHATVRSIRKGHGNAIIGLIMNMLQTLMLVTVFYLLMSVASMRSFAIRGDFVLYVMSGIFIYMTHIKTVSAVASAEGPTSQMMKHAPMNPIIAVAAAAFGSLYNQALSAAVVLFIYHSVVTPIHIDNPVMTGAMFMLAWASGAAIGLIGYAATPWNPSLVKLLVSLYTRINMVASGKMFLANTLSAAMLGMFDWNPLFHIIDQIRGFVFLNYSPHNTELAYPVEVTLVCLVIGMMGIFYTRRYASMSWGV